MSNKKVVTRIAPSPTGMMHIGTVRTALFNYLFARQHGGSYFVRIEDTDKERYQSEWVDAIWNDFAWLGLEPDMRYVQSEHVARHKELLHSLVENGRAYISKETAKDGSGREVEVVRLKNPGKAVTFQDLVHGEITFDTTELGDFVIARSIDDPLYHFAVVADDADAGVTHVIRGEDHISNTPRQILIQESLDFERPVYAHLPLILAPDRSKLSKRKHGASVENYKAQGYLPDAIINFLALLGWNPGDDRELFTTSELLEVFSLDKVQKSPAVFNEQKLAWFNKNYLTHLPPEEVLAEAKTRLGEAVTGLPQYSETRLKVVLPQLIERIEKWGDLTQLAEMGEVSYYFKAPDYSTAALSFKGETPLNDIREHLTTVSEALQNISEDQFGAETVKAAIWDYATEVGRGAVLWPLRFALSGKDKSPDPFTLSEILGKEETIARVITALKRIEQSLNEV